MKKIILLVLLVFILNSCSFFQRKIDVDILNEFEAIMNSENTILTWFSKSYNLGKSINHEEVDTALIKFNFYSLKGDLEVIDELFENIDVNVDNEKIVSFYFSDFKPILEKYILLVDDFILKVDTVEMTYDEYNNSYLELYDLGEELYSKDAIMLDYLYRYVYNIRVLSFD